MKQENQNNLQYLDNDYVKENYGKQVKKQREVIFRRRRLAAIMVVATALFISLGIPLFNDYLRLQNLKTYQEQTILDQKALEEEVAALQKEVDLLHDDDYVAKIARERFYYSKEGELLFPLPESETANK
ncbi:MAG: septum formation initiator family protein [Enterococcus sp.]|jgi:cell division protein DivIC|nr:septum formation initiator family protein [Enterococcus sp.]